MPTIHRVCLAVLFDSSICFGFYTGTRQTLYPFEMENQVISYDRFTAILLEVDSQT